MKKVNNKEFEYINGILSIKEYFSEFEVGFFKINLNKEEVMTILKLIINNLR